jgi:hypothetical protein
MTSGDPASGAAASPCAEAGTAQEATAGERLRRVDALDLEPIVYKLMHPEPGEAGLSLARADQHVALYRGFLKLCVLHPGITLVPTRQLDHVWHTHLLDTAKYRADCDHAFGRFMDHFPYFGFRGKDDRRAWRDDFARTRRLFTEHFGVEIGTQPAASACTNHGDGSACCIGCVRPRQATPAHGPTAARRPPEMGSATAAATEPARP